MRIAHRWDAINEETNAIENAKADGEKYTPEVLDNGGTKKQLLARSRYLLFKSGDKWTERQKKRAAILFDLYPDIKQDYSRTHSLRMYSRKIPTKAWLIRMLPNQVLNLSIQYLQHFIPIIPKY